MRDAWRIWLTRFETSTSRCQALGAWLEAGGGVTTERGCGFAVMPRAAVTGAIIFDMLNGGDKKWGPPPRDLGYAAADAASDSFALGSVGAGLGATTATLKGGLGSASAKTDSGVTVAALAVVNAVSSTIVGTGPHFWAAPFEIGNEFGGRGLPAKFTSDMLKVRLKGGAAAAAGENTTIAIVVTDAKLDRTQKAPRHHRRRACRAIYPVYAPRWRRGFAAATGARPVDLNAGLTELAPSPPTSWPAPRPRRL